MDKHSCIIGLLHLVDDSELCTVDGLKAHIADNIEFNQWLDDDPVFRKCQDMKHKVWTLKEYADRRRSTNLRRFEYCPECGKRINWTALKGE